jgi:hypothetical protein
VRTYSISLAWTGKSGHLTIHKYSCNQGCNITPPFRKACPQVPNPLIAICSSNYSTGSLSESQDSSTDSDNKSDSDSDSDSEFDDGPVQKKRKADDSQRRANNRSHSFHITPALAATAPQESVAAIDGQSATLATNTSMISEPNDPKRLQQVTEVTDGEQEWDIRDIIGKEVVDGEVHYLVEWSATLVPKYDLGKAKVLVDKFEAQLRAQCRQRVGERRGRLPPPKAGKHAIAGARATGKTQQKKGRGRPQKQV